MVTLVTGITGLIGSEYFKIITKDTTHLYYLMIREAKVAHWQEEVSGLDHIHIVTGDLLTPDLFVETDGGYSAQDLKLLEKVERIVHLAALYDLAAEYSDLYKVNVIGTQNLLFFAGKCSKLKKIFYASTMLSLEITKVSSQKMIST